VEPKGVVVRKAMDEDEEVVERGRKHSRLDVRALSCRFARCFSRMVWVERKVWRSRLERVKVRGGMGVRGGRWRSARPHGPSPKGMVRGKGDERKGVSKL